MRRLGAFSPLWREYPDYRTFPDSARVKRDIGGSVDQKHLVNTCAIRLSRALNYNGVPLTRASYMVTKRGADGKRYAVRVREIRRWLFSVLGKPAFDLRKKEGVPFDKRTLAPFRGIIGFDIRFSDATGHLDLWDGRYFSAEGKMSRDAWSASTRIWLWPTTG